MKLKEVLKEYVNTNKENFGTYQTKNTSQELEVIELLEKHGFVNKGKLKKDDGFYVQPFGSQRNPDILVIESGHVFNLMCKSAKTKICYNSTKPIQDAIYIINNKGFRCIKIGKELMTLEEHVVFDEYEKKLNELSREYELKRKTCEQDSGITIFGRKAYYAKCVYKETDFELINKYLERK